MQRLVEIGPSNTLTGMAKRTVDLKYKSQDAASAIKRQMLSCKLNEDEIYYEHPAEEGTMRSTLGKKKTTEATITAPSNSPDVTPTIHVPVQRKRLLRRTLMHNKAILRHQFLWLKAPSAMAPVTALEILLTIVAAKLNKKLADVTASSSIKILSGGAYLSNALSECAHC